MQRTQEPLQTFEKRYKQPAHPSASVEGSLNLQTQQYMKKFLLAFILAIGSITLSAQNISYANVVKLAKTASVTSTLLSWGYKLENISIGEWGQHYYWVYKKGGYARVDWSIMYGYGSSFLFSFSSAETYRQLESQIKKAGWKFLEQYETRRGYLKVYEKEGTTDYIELAKGHGKFSICYNIPE